MNPKETVPTLQVTAAMLLPGMMHARALLDVSIRVLQYFHSHAASDVAMGSATTFKGTEPDLIREAEQVKALLSAFGRLHGKSN